MLARIAAASVAAAGKVSRMQLRPGPRRRCQQQQQPSYNLRPRSVVYFEGEDDSRRRHRRVGGPLVHDRSLHRYRTTTTGWYGHV